jgi:hypothetical protein
MKIEIVGGASPKEGVNLGDIFNVKTYLFDRSKYTLLEKVSGSKKKYIPETLNHYKCDSKLI